MEVEFIRPIVHQELWKGEVRGRCQPLTRSKQVQPLFRVLLFPQPSPIKACGGRSDACSRGPRCIEFGVALLSFAMDRVSYVS
jgi:hypothetical protein